MFTYTNGLTVPGGRNPKSPTAAMLSRYMQALSKTSLFLTTLVLSCLLACTSQQEKKNNLNTLPAVSNDTTSKYSTKNIISLTDEYTALASRGEWKKALPVIEELVGQDSTIGTSWFNYGVCLDALKRHKEAAMSFMAAYQLDPKDYGAQYRIYRSLNLANDISGFAQFLKKDIIVVPEISDLLIKESEFDTITAQPQIKEILRQVPK